jgi:hypothetical protein
MGGCRLQGRSQGAALAAHGDARRIKMKFGEYPRAGLPVAILTLILSPAVLSAGF